MGAVSAYTEWSLAIDAGAPCTEHWAPTGAINIARVDAMWLQAPPGAESEAEYDVTIRFASAPPLVLRGRPPFRIPLEGEPESVSWEPVAPAAST